MRIPILFLVAFVGVLLGCTRSSNGVELRHPRQVGFRAYPNGWESSEFVNESREAWLRKLSAHGGKQEMHCSAIKLQLSPKLYIEDQLARRYAAWDLIGHQIDVTGDEMHAFASFGAREGGRRDGQDLRHYIVVHRLSPPGIEPIDLVCHGEWPASEDFQNTRDLNQLASLFQYE